jgi:Sulfatase
MKLKTELVINSVDIFVLTSFAIAEPLFELLSRNVEFFIARRSEPLEIILLVLGLCLFLPSLILLFEVLAGALAPKFRRAVHSAALAALFALMLLPLLKRTGGIPGTVLVPLAAILGIALSAAYLRFRTGRFSLVFLLPAVFIFPILFLFRSPIYRVIWGGENSDLSYPKVKATTPIVMVVFDEFPVVSLMDENRQVDATRYPNFAALAQNAIWYRNATSVSEGTMIAVPVILDGLYPRGRPQRLPNAADHPHSLFTLLGGSYKLNVVENNTRVCPEHLCGKAARKTSLGQQMQRLLSDLGVLYLYLILPSDLARGLPDITQSWKDFAAGRGKPRHPSNPFLDYFELTHWADRPRQFKEFVQSIQPSSQPTLHFLHILLPHALWEYLPSGKKYTLPEVGIRGVVGTNERGEDPNRWTDDKWAVIQAYQRHLLQVGLVDGLLGYLLDHLKTIGLYDPALIVITADHGNSFRPNDSRRTPTPTNYPDIMAVPLFMKLPYQKEGKITDRNVETIDILPTIADILKVKMPWGVDGRSALDESVPERKNKIIFTDPGKKLVFDHKMEGKYDALEQKLRLFGSGSKPDGLFRIGAHDELIGQPVGEIGTIGQAPVEWELDSGAYFNNVDFTAPLVLTHITGRVQRLRSGSEKPLDLAVGVNGMIRAETETHWVDGQERFSAVVPESSFRPGRNDVSIFLVSKSNGHLTLAEAKRISIPEYHWGEVIHFGMQGNARSYQAEGWCLPAPNEAFTWSNGRRATLVIPGSVPKSPVSIRTTVGAFIVPGKVGRQRLRVLIQGQTAAEWEITKPGFHERSTNIPKELLTDPQQTVITFEMPDAASPIEVGVGGDVRELAIAFESLRLTEQAADTDPDLTENAVPKAQDKIQSLGKKTVEKLKGFFR